MANNFPEYHEINETLPSGLTLEGSSTYVGDGVALTAGHVHFGVRPAVSVTARRVTDQPGTTVVLDFRQYEAALQTALTNFRAQRSTESTADYLLAMGNVQSGAALRALDTIFADVSGNMNVDKDNAGIVVFYDSSDITGSEFGLGTVGDDAKVQWEGSRTGEHLDGRLSKVGAYGFLTYSGSADPTDDYGGPGDSGAGIVLNFANDYLGLGSRRFVLGNVHSIDPIASAAVGNQPEDRRGPIEANWIKPAEFEKLMEYLALNTGQGGTQTNDVTETEPTNLIVGSYTNEIVSGSFRADIILGRGAYDSLSDGDEDGDTVWANDQLFGGDYVDLLRAGAGDDLLHGGDFRQYGGAPRLSLEDDGGDIVDYRQQVTRSASDPGLTVKIGVQGGGDEPAWTNSKYGDDEDKDAAIYVADQNQATGRSLGTDALVSIESLSTTDADDTIELHGLSGKYLAGADRVGGAATIDLAGHATGQGKGDLIDASRLSADLVIDLSSPSNNVREKDGGADNVLTVLGAERAWGGTGDDTLTASSSGSELFGRDGADTINGGAGVDFLVGGEGGDTLVGGAGVDTLVGGNYADGTFSDDNGARDTIVAEGGDYIYSSDQDTIEGDKAGAHLFAPDGTPLPMMMAFSPMAAPGGMSFKLLTGGEAEAPPADPCNPSPGPDQGNGKTYTAADGTEYTLSGGKLTVDYGGGTVYVQGFRNGDAGIRLKDTRPDIDQAECQRDPLIIDLDGDRNVVRELFDSFAYFDLDNDGFREHVAWTLPGDGLLVRDRNGNGTIDDGSELFGSGRAERDGGEVGLAGEAGFVELAQLDSNSDGLISAADLEFATLRVWIDANGDALTDDGELKTLAELGLVSISLTTRVSDDLDCGCDGTQVTRASSALFADGAIRTVYDAYLSIDQYDTREIVTDVTVPAEFAELPFLLGTGTLSDLDVAMARDPALEEMVRAFAALDPSQASEILGRAQEILLRWAGADDVVADSRGGSINARWLEALETISGSEFVQARVGSDPRADAAAIMIEDWQEIVARTAAKLLGQTALGEQLLPGLSFEAAAFFGAAEGVDLAAVLQNAAEHAPAPAFEGIRYWAGIVGVLDQYRGVLGLDATAFDAALEDALAAANVRFDVAALRTALVADASTGKVFGSNANHLVDADGDDLILLAPGGTADGTGGQDSYVAGSGTGTAMIQDRSGPNTLYLVDHASTDVVVSADVVDGRFVMRFADAGGTLDLLVGLSVESTRVQADVQRVIFADGVVADALGLLPVSGIGGALVIGGTDGIIEGSPANELLVGFGGANSYRFGPGDGNDTISDQGDGGDRLILRATRAEVSIGTIRSDAETDLVLTITATGETVRLAGQQSSVRSVIETIEFTDGTLSAGEIDRFLTIGTSGDDTIFGSVRDDEMRGLEGADVLRGGGGRDTYVLDLGWGADRIVDEDKFNTVAFGEGIAVTDVTVSRAGANGTDLRLTVGGNELVIAGGLQQQIVSEFSFHGGPTVSLLDYIAQLNVGPANVMFGTGFADELVGSAGPDRFIGNGGQDIFYGNGGFDTYEIGLGGVTIEASDVGVDTAIAPSGSSLWDFRFIDAYGRYLSFGDGLAGSVAYGELDNVVFDDGTVLSFTGGDVVTGTAGADFLYHLNYAAATFTPGAGDDVMIGSGDEVVDTYRFDVGFGHDVIYDMGGRGDQIVFQSPELSVDNAEMSRIGQNLVIAFNSGDQLTVEGFFWNYNYPPDSGYWGQTAGVIESIVFGGGEFGWGDYFTSDDIVSAISSQTAGDDWVMTDFWTHPEEFRSRDGGAGNDILVGGDQSETYVFRTGHGHDIIKDSGSSQYYNEDSLYFLGLSIGEVGISRSADDASSIVFTILATGETLTVDGTPEDGFNGFWLPMSDQHRGRLRIEQYHFTDGILMRDQVAQQLLGAASTDGDDRIIGFNEDHRIDAGRGDDHISVLDGYDTIVLRPDGGHDVLDFLSTGRGYGINLEFAGILPEDVVLLQMDEHDGKPGRHLLVVTGENSSLLILNGLETSLYPSGEGGRTGLFSLTFPGLDWYPNFDAEPSNWLGRLEPLYDGTEGEDVLQGEIVQGWDPEWDPGEEVFDPRGGDDLILGTAGSEKVIFDVGYGVDRYEVNGGWLTVVLGPDLTSSDIALRWLPDEPGMVELSIVGTDDRLLFDGRSLAAIQAADVTLTVGGVDPDDPDLLTPIELEHGTFVEATGGRERFVAVDGDVILEFGSDGGADFFEDARFRAALDGTGDLVDWVPNQVVLRGSSDVDDYRFLRLAGDPADLVIVGPSGEQLTIRDQFALGEPEVRQGWQDADADGDGAVDWQGIDLDGDEVPDFAALDSDGDGAPDWQAADFDGDGQSDWVHYRYAYAAWDGGEISAQDVDLDGSFDIYWAWTGQYFALRDVTGDGVPDEYSLDEVDWITAPTGGAGATDWSLLDIEGDGVFELAGFGPEGSSGLDWISGYVSGPDHAGWSISEFAELYSPIADRWVTREQEDGSIVYSLYNPGDTAVLLARDTDGDGVPDQVGIDRDYDGAPDAVVVSSPAMVVERLAFGGLPEWGYDSFSVAELMDRIEFVPVLEVELDLEALKPVPTEGAESLLLPAGDSIDTLAGNDIVTIFGEGGELRWSAGDGDDVLRRASMFEPAGLTVRIEGIVDPGQLRFLRAADDDNDLIVEISATGERLRIEGQLGIPEGVFAGELAPTVARFVFDGGLELSAGAVALRVAGLALDDDVVHSSPKGSLLNGGSGNDILLGGSGDDVYLFGEAYAEDRIQDAGGSDRIRFGEGIGSTSLYFSRTGGDGDDLLIEVMGTERLALTVADQFSNPSARIETLAFADGETIFWSQVQQQILDLAETGGDDIIVGFRESDRIRGGAGQDRLAGAEGDDLIFGGAGRDVAVFAGASADYTIVFGDGFVTVTDTVVGRDGVDRLEGVEDLAFLADGSVFQAVPGNSIPTISAPLAFDVAEDGVVSIPLVQLLASVSDADGDTLSLSSLHSAVHGRAWFGATGDVRFQPDADFNGAAAFSFAVSDGNGGTATGTVAITVAPAQDAPRQVATLDDVTILEDGVVDFIVPATAFADADGDPLTLDARLAGGGQLPGWLHFDGVRLTGTAPPDAHGTFELEIHASDGERAVTAPLTLTVSPVNDAPRLAVQPADVAITPGEVLSFELAATAFTDPDGDALSYRIVAADGGALPAWLRADGLLLTGTVPDELVEPVQLAIVAHDGRAIGQASFALVPSAANSAPVAGAPIGTLAFVEDEGISFAIPSDAFVDPDGDVLSYVVTLAGGSPLPAWLTFDGSHLTGAPPPDFNGTIALAVTASDGSASATSSFSLAIAPVNDAPAVLVPLADRSSPEDEVIAVAIPSDAFGDVDGDALSVTAKLADGSALPAWLAFDGAAFNGTPAANFNGSLLITVSAGDGVLSVSDSFVLAVTPVNDAPILAAALADQAVAAGALFDWTVPATSFTDIDGDTLTLTAALADGSALPSWLSFAGGRLTGTAPGGAEGAIDLRVTASDGSLSASDSFSLAITDANSAPLAADDGLFIGLQTQALVILAGDLLINDTDADGDPLTLVSVADGAHGQVAINADGNVVFSIDSTFLGAASFTYVVSDGIAEASATVSVRIDSLYQGWSQGGAGNDKLFGNHNASNHIFGGDGNDHVKGGKGDDWLAGGNGADQIQGLQANDHLWGNAGNDELIGNGGFDTAYFYGLRSSYQIQTVNGTVRVVDGAPGVDGNDGTDTISSIEQLSFKNGETASIVSPIVLDLAGDGVQTLTARQSRARIDLNGDGRLDDTSWIGRNDAFLFLDRNGDGRLSGATEISFIDDLPNAASDLAGLRAFDSNADGTLDSADDRFSDFGIWRDADGDGKVDRGETYGLAGAGIASLGLAGTPNDGSTALGEVAIVNTGVYTRIDGSIHAFADAALTYFSGPAGPGRTADRAAFLRMDPGDLATDVGERAMPGGTVPRGAFVDDRALADGGALPRDLWMMHGGGDHLAAGGDFLIP